MVSRYTKEQIQFIRDVAPGRYNSEIAELFNKQFGTNVTDTQIKSTKANYKIRSNVSTKKPNEDGLLFKKEHKNFIKVNVKGISNKKLTDMLNQKFNTTFTVDQVKRWKNNHGLSSGLKGSEGVAPPNKGTKGLYNVGGNKTSFKKGNVPANYKPVGTERVDRDGYVLIKVSDKGEWHERWRHKHKVIWEQANGPIPEGHVIIFLDRNKQNITLENLQLITQSQLARMNYNHLFYKDPELTKTGTVIADIFNKIGERKKRGGAKCERGSKKNTSAKVSL